jgi:hypothetical protein
VSSSGVFRPFSHVRIVSFFDHAPLQVGVGLVTPLCLPFPPAFRQPWVKGSLARSLATAAVAVAREDSAGGTSQDADPACRFTQATAAAAAEAAAAAAGACSRCRWWNQASKLLPGPAARSSRLGGRISVHPRCPPCETPHLSLCPCISCMHGRAPSLRTYPMRQHRGGYVAPPRWR